MITALVVEFPYLIFYIFFMDAWSLQMDLILCICNVNNICLMLLMCSSLRCLVYTTFSPVSSRATSIVCFSKNEKKDKIQLLTSQLGSFRTLTIQYSSCLSLLRKTNILNILYLHILPILPINILSLAW